jgi:catechol 2,3-dioxygenase-like lactoylglutathione lyase family enzyme
MFMRIDHIELVTAAPEGAVAFYRDVLGFRERERTRIPQTPVKRPEYARAGIRDPDGNPIELRPWYR